MKKWTVEQVEAARTNDEMRRKCEPWMQKMFDVCPNGERLWKSGLHNEWEVDPDRRLWQSLEYRISQDWPPADQIEDAKPTPADFSTQYMLDDKPYHPEDDATELQRLIDGRDEINDGIKVIRARMRRFDRFVAKKKWGKG